MAIDMHTNIQKERKDHTCRHSLIALSLDLKL